jgi:L-ascorbate metabolism protein UlaG (beta-lactamase superfamily)
MSEQPALLEKLVWLGHSSFRLEASKRLYFDPWQLKGDQPAADIILVSHDHHDHCSPEDIARLQQPGTVIVANPSAAAALQGDVRVMKAGDTLDLEGVRIQTLPAYNVEKRFHPRAAGHIGFLVEIDGERLYFAGDTDVIPEMRGLVCDIALLPVSGIYVMTAEEAAQAAGMIKARLAVPMHYGAGVAGTLADAERFRELSPIPVTILPGPSA